MAATMQTSRTQVVSTTGKRATQMAAVKPAYSSAASSMARCSPAVSREAAFVAPAPVASSRAVVVRAALAPAPAAQKPATKEWYALVASAEWFFNDAQNESMAEQLRERVRFLKEQGKETDFYIVPEPKWLEARYPNEAKRVRRPAVALVSTDKHWITFMKLRLDRVLKFDLGPVADADALAVGGTIPDYKGPEKWTAPYARYASGWWNVFVPKH